MLLLAGVLCHHDAGEDAGQPAVDETHDQGGDDPEKVLGLRVRKPAGEDGVERADVARGKWQPLDLLERQQADQAAWHRLARRRDSSAERNAWTNARRDWCEVLQPGGRHVVRLGPRRLPHLPRML